jgi:hypothetical protein
MKVKVKVDCIACLGEGSVYKGAWSHDEVPEFEKCSNCNGYKYVLRTEEVPDDVKEERIMVYKEDLPKTEKKWDDGLVPGEMIF